MVRLAHILGFMCLCFLYLQFYVVGLVLFMLLYSTFLISCCVFIYVVCLRPVHCVPVSLDCPFFIADSVFSNVYLYAISISK